MNAERETGATVEVRSRKYDGRVSRRWEADLIERTPSLIVLRGTFAEEVRHALLGTVERGTVSTEYYWTDRWYSIFVFVTPDGALRNYYGNVNLPPIFDGRVLSYVDLDIDLLVAPDLSYQVVDEEEFRVNRARYAYPPEFDERAYAALAELISLVEQRRFPFRAPRP